MKNKSKNVLRMVSEYRRWKKNTMEITKVLIEACLSNFGAKPCGQSTLGLRREIPLLSR